jgi:hypothetical protein
VRKFEEFLKMSSQKFSDSNPTPLPPAKPDTLLVSDPLTQANPHEVGAN